MQVMQPDIKMSVYECGEWQLYFKWDGCFEIRTSDGGHVHICGINEFEKFLVEAKKRAIEFFKAEDMEPEFE